MLRLFAHGLNRNFSASLHTHYIWIVPLERTRIRLDYEPLCQQSIDRTTGLDSEQSSMCTCMRKSNVNKQITYIANLSNLL